jgi:hypothetical protein
LASSGTIRTCARLQVASNVVNKKATKDREMRRKIPSGEA